MSSIQMMAGVNLFSCLLTSVSLLQQVCKLSMERARHPVSADVRDFLYFSAGLGSRSRVFLAPWSWSRLKKSRSRSRLEKKVRSRSR